MYNWIESTFNVSGGVTQAIAVVLALAAVLLLFSLFVFVLKRLMGTNLPHPKNRQPRVAVMDSTAVDARRRLVLIRRDNVEHLILIGGPSDVVVEQQIIRSAPIVQPRAGQHTNAQAQPPLPQQAASTLPGALKMPMAPGPDIPLRPDETAVQAAGPSAPQSGLSGASSAEDTLQSSSLADSARAAIALKASVPELDLPRKAPKPEPRSFDAPAQASPVEARPAPAGPALEISSAPTPEPAPKEDTPSASRLKAPVVNGPSNRQRNGLAGAPKAPVAATPAAAKATPEKETDAPQPLTRAAALLRAATQNGFNRASPATGKTANGQTPAPAETAVHAEGSVPKMPGIIPAPSGKPAETSSQQGGAAGAAFQSLAKTLGGRERAPQSGHSITPPASGPAARAKTALLKPVEPAQAKKVEPVLAASASPAVVPPAFRTEAAAEKDTPEIKVPDAGPATAATDGSDVAAAQTGPASDPALVGGTANGSASPASLQAPKAQDTPDDGAPSLNGASAAENTGPATADTAIPETAVPETLAPDTLTPENPAQPETGASESSARPAAPLDAPEAAAASNGSEPPPKDAATGQVDLDLELGDLIETETEEVQKAPAGKLESVTVTEQPAAQTQSQIKPASPGLTSSAAGRLDISAGKASDPKPPRVVQGLGDRNPIEDEMAKILNELGGQPNQ